MNCRDCRLPTPAPAPGSSRLTASSTPGQILPKRGCSASTAPGTAAPMRKPPSAVSSMAVISAIFLMSTIRPGRTLPARICTRRSVPPARTRAALPAAAKAETASSSVRGLTYRISVMWFPPFPFCARAPGDCRLTFAEGAGRESADYTGCGDWNSLRARCQRQAPMHGARLPHVLAIGARKRAGFFVTAGLDPAIPVFE